MKAEKLITDEQGQILKVVLEFEEYQRLLEAIEDEGLYRAMQVMTGETPLRINEALAELEDKSRLKN